MSETIDYISSGVYHWLQYCARCKIEIPNPLDTAHPGICTNCMLEAINADD